MFEARRYLSIKFQFNLRSKAVQDDVISTEYGSSYYVSPPTRPVRRQWDGDD